jgi:signal peptidase II
MTLSPLLKIMSLLRRRLGKTFFRLVFLLATMVLLIGCDQATKHFAKVHLAGKVPLTYWGDTARLIYVENTGAMLSLGAGLSGGLRFWLLTVAVAIVLAGIGVYTVVGKQLSLVGVLALSLVVSGGVGNLIDRIANDGRVIDFMNVGIGSFRTGIFNVADMAIMAGSLLMLWGLKPKL